VAGHTGSGIDYGVKGERGEFQLAAHNMKQIQTLQWGYNLKRMEAGWSGTETHHRDNGKFSMLTVEDGEI